MSTDETLTDLYLRLSDLRNEEALDGRVDKLRAEAGRIGWTVHRVVIENDMVVNGGGKLRPASAWKRKKITTPSGRVELRTIRPGFRSVLDDMMSGVNLLAEDLDRMVRQPRDGEDLLDAVEMSGTSARSLSGSLTLTDGGTDAERMTARIMAAVASKSSADTARRVASARERLAGQSYQGGRRPFGFRIAGGTEQYHRNLVIDDAEAAVIRDAAEGILDRGISLKAAARDLRDRGVPTVTGAAWTASTLRDVLSKPAVAGLAAHRGELRPAPWPAILERDQWEQADRAVRRTQDRHEQRAALAGVLLRDVRRVRRPGQMHRGQQPPGLHLRRTRPRAPERPGRRRAHSRAHGRVPEQAHGRPATAPAPAGNGHGEAPGRGQAAARPQALPDEAARGRGHR